VEKIPGVKDKEKTKITTKVKAGGDQ
jgi:hypothetical protein